MESSSYTISDGNIHGHLPCSGHCPFLQKPNLCFEDDSSAQEGLWLWGRDAKCRDHLMTLRLSCRFIHRGTLQIDWFEVCNR